MVSEEAILLDRNGYLPSRKVMTEKEYVAEAVQRNQLDDMVFKNSVGFVTNLLGGKEPRSVDICDPLTPPDPESNQRYIHNGSLFLERFACPPSYGLVLDPIDFMAIAMEHGHSDYYEKNGNIVYCANDNVSMPIILLNSRADDILKECMHQNIHRLHAQIAYKKPCFSELLANNWNSKNVQVDLGSSSISHRYAQNFERLMSLGVVRGINMRYVLSRLDGDEFKDLDPNNKDKELDEQIRELPGIRGGLIRANIWLE